MNPTIKLACLSLFTCSLTSVTTLAGECGSKAKNTETVMTVSTEEEAKSVVAIAAGNKDFSTLVAAVKAAGLAEALSGKGPFTIFALEFIN